MKRKLIFLAGFFFLTPFIIYSLVAVVLYLGYQNKILSQQTSHLAKDAVYYQAIPGKNSDMYVNIFNQDARIEALQAFFQKYKSPLFEHAEKIVKEADKYELDYRLLPAIAMQESNLCKKIPENSYNCFGFGIYGGKVLKFSDFTEAIEIVSKTMAKEYKDKGYEQVEEIRTKYNPANTNNWAEGVTHFMDIIRESL